MLRFHENLKEARILKGLKQKELAESLGITQASISQFEKGERIPTSINIKKIAEILDVSPEELTGDENAVIGQTQLMREIKGISPKGLDEIRSYVDYVKSKEKI